LPGLIFLMLGLACAPLSVQAHKPSDSYLTLRLGENQCAGEWHLALRDLDYAISLDADDDGAITWRELRARQAEITAYALSRLQIRDAERTGRIVVREFLVDYHSDGAYAVLRFDLAGLSYSSKLQIEYRAFFDLDPLHRGLLRLESRGTTRSAIFSPESAIQPFDLSNVSPGSPKLSFLKEGIWHIWTGYDHILFLIALLLPGVLQRRAAGWEPQREVGTILAEVLKTVTAFTLAHSITLSLAAFGVVRLPARFVEMAIAASVLFAALNNIVPLWYERSWLVTFSFGLLHGFGFANALNDLGLLRSALAKTLFGFNAGVELGQLAIVALFLPFALSLRNREFYRHRLLPAGSVAIGLVASAWFVERLFDYKL
jgi:hypothetical protein